ncbi:ABC transporter (plasmid) [Roseobacter litoralis Och 149]|uniref:ABC transporter n=2 Tax=Roseobacter litoralis TaxID=42443 RepID=F7ZML8_ROSLO|nr:ABC transporter [Roseobacter litoralis Och 149]
MLQNYRLVWGILSRRERGQFILLIVMSILMALFEVVGVAAILPFLAMIGDPSIIETNVAIALFARVIGSTDVKQITVAFGFTVLAMLVLGMAVRALGTYGQVRFSMMRAFTIATRLLRVYLRQPYVWFLTQNTSEFGQSLLSEIDMVVRQSILPAVLLVSNITITILIVAVLFITEPAVALGAFGLLGGVYVLIYFALRKRLDLVGKERIDFNKERFRTVQEIGGGIKEIKVMGLEDIALSRFHGPAFGMARTQSAANVMGKIPRFALEAVIYGGFILMVLFMLIVKERQIEELLPLFGLLGLSSIKLFPALQTIYAQLSLIRFTAPALTRLHCDVTTLSIPPVTPEGAPIRLNKVLEISDLHFRYPESDRSTLHGISTTIAARSTVGIVGGTGAGKTTVVDLILGLLAPTEGEIRVDGTPITPERRRDWQKTLGYVPQTIFLIDDTVAANIAFGVPPEKVDMAAIEAAARTANLHEFVLNNLPEGYNTRVGERGVRLSGGQRQRIGIARALYFDPDVLVLDEATSALDNLTEKTVMEAVDNLAGAKTIIMIAHRLSTVQNCDTILLLSHGKIVAEGHYKALMQNEEFRRMANT